MKCLNVNVNKEIRIYLCNKNFKCSFVIYVFMNKFCEVGVLDVKYVWLFEYGNFVFINLII